MKKYVMVFLASVFFFTSWACQESANVDGSGLAPAERQIANLPPQLIQGYQDATAAGKLQSLKGTPLLGPTSSEFFKLAGFQESYYNPLKNMMGFNRLRELDLSQVALNRLSADYQINGAGSKGRFSAGENWIYNQPYNAPVGTAYLNAVYKATKQTDGNLWSEAKATSEVGKLQATISSLESGARNEVQEAAYLSAKTNLDWRQKQLALYAQIPEQYRPLLAELLSTPAVVEFDDLTLADVTKNSNRAWPGEGTRLIAEEKPWASAARIYVPNSLSEEAMNLLKAALPNTEIVVYGKASVWKDAWYELQIQYRNMPIYFNTVMTEWLPFIGDITVLYAPAGIKVAEYADVMADYDVAVASGSTSLDPEQWYELKSHYLTSLSNFGCDEYGNFCIYQPALAMAGINELSMPNPWSGVQLSQGQTGTIEVKVYAGDGVYYRADDGSIQPGVALVDKDNTLATLSVTYNSWATDRPNITLADGGGSMTVAPKEPSDQGSAINVGCQPSGDGGQLNTIIFVRWIANPDRTKVSILFRPMMWVADTCETGR